MNATIPQMLQNIITNAKEIAQSRDATEDIADAAAAIIDEATEILAAIPTEQEWKELEEEKDESS